MACNRAVNCRELKQQVTSLTAPVAARHLVDALESKQLKTSDFSIRELAEAFMGREWVDSMQPKSGRYVDVQEATGDVVAYHQLSHITGQIFFTEIKDAYETEDLIFSKIVPTIASKIQDMEKLAGISEVGDEFTVLGEGDLYPNFGVSEDWVEIAAKQKRGGIVPVTKEAIFGDLTGKLQERCRSIGKYLAINKEKRIIDAFVDENAGAVSAALGGHRYHWKGTSYATHQTATPWINVKTSNALVDHTDIENAWLIGTAILDPYTGEPTPFRPKHLVVTQQNYMTALRILRATNVQTHAGGYATSGNLIDTHAPSPVNDVLPGLIPVTSALLATRTATDTDWWLGDIARVVHYYSNWDVTPEEAPPQNREQFTRDIVFQVKASEKGVASVVEPRAVVESRA